MGRYLVEVAHPADRRGCAEVVEIFLRTGSHYLTHADWGCSDGDHRSWMIVEAGSRDEARRVVPPPYRAKAIVVRLNRFTLAELARLMQHHRQPTSRRQHLLEPLEPVVRIPHS